MMAMYPGYTEEAYAPRQFSFKVSSIVCDTEAEAWKDFESHAQEMFFWVRGKKWWRRVPTCRFVTDFDSDIRGYVVSARVLALIDPPEDLEEASPNAPYPTNNYDIDFVAYVGVA